jgi:predicted enzyme related to lactoylglutathione lyase
MNIDTYADGMPSWVELATPDAPAAVRFYGELFGWRAEPGSADLQERSTCLLRGRPVAAITSRAGLEHATWTTYVDVGDVDKTAADVTAAGGTITTAPSDTADIGRTALVTDHSGATFAVRQTGQRDGTGLVDEPGSFSWAELITDDVEASAAFYGRVFRWTLTSPEGALNRRNWKLNDHAFSGLLPRPAGMPAEIPPYWDVYFTVADADTTVATVTRLGGAVLMPATATGHGTIAVFRDPAGGVFSVKEAAH